MPAFFPRPALLTHIPAGAHAVIEASAGTGKTFTIEHLVVDRLLSGEASLEQILVVTFTEKATGELKTRIRDLVTRVLETPEGDAPAEGPCWVVDGPARVRLTDALFTFDRAPIFTIHGFCHRVLFDLAFESGHLFDFEVVDGTRAFNRAFRECLRTVFTVDASHRGQLRAWLDDGRDEAGLERLLFQAYRQRYLDGLESVDDALPRLLGRLAVDFSAASIATDLEGVALQQAAVEGALQVVHQIQAALDADLADGDRLAAVTSLPLEHLLRPRRTAPHGKRRFPDELAASTRRVLDVLQQLRTLRAMAASIERAVVDAFLPVVLDRLAAFKRQEGLLDYDDLLERVQTSLAGPDGPALAQTLRGRYRLALIDEFQDTDDRQWDIFRRVFVESDAGHRLYVIGDPKQAIYGFRGADVHTYLVARDELEASGAPRLALDTAYRHSPALTDALNLVLEQGRDPLFSGAIRYEVPVRCGRPTLRLVDAFGEEQPPVILWRYKPPPPKARERETLARWRLDEAFAGQLGESLHRLLLTPEGALFTDDPARGGRRPIRPQDVFVLCRGNWDAQLAADALDRVGVPYAFYKQDGLFQTMEAQDVRDVLAAVADPHDRSARMRALATPFFAVPWARLRDYRELAGGHPITERLFAWHQLATQERFAALYHRVLHESGLVERALFLEETERALCNYQHILEVLLEQGGRRRLSLAETLELMDRFILGTEQPEGGDGNIQRLPDERDAVQIMTIHRAKGLEAPVVCLFGGFGQGQPRPVNVVHGPDGRRRVLVGRPAHDAWAQQIAQEQMEEDERLLYVALTRAKVRLYLPFIDSSRGVQGAYAPLKARLGAVVRDGAGPGFQQVEVPEQTRARVAPAPDPREPLDAWRPPGRLLAAEEDGSFEALRRRAAPLLVTSYTRMKEEGLSPVVEEDPAPVEADEFKVDEGAVEEAHPADAHVLPGGRHVGRFLHEVIEALDFGTFGETPSLDAWSREPTVRGVFQEVMRRHGIDPRWLAAGQALIFDALASPLTLGGVAVGALYRCRHVVELEFLYPLPEAAHPLLSRPDAGGDWRAERGFIKGFVDFVFEHQGRVYFADWKSDVLPDYAPEALDPHVAEHYELQARLYCLGIVRWLGLRDEAAYEARFGGLLYLFLRGLAARPGDGVWFRRPSWADVVAWEADLLVLGRPAPAAEASA
ncbi:MAG: UvrD-helicase domain-containing protein [Myxococcales bacterium]|nr:UvrD-helicase domain-containing protein [Myxococcales bacterium]